MSLYLLCFFIIFTYSKEITTSLTENPLLQYRSNRHRSTTKAGSSSIYNVQDYGALGNGNNDDTSAIIKAINTCISTGNGGVIFFPKGLYLTTSTINIPYSGPLELSGEGWDSIILWSSNVDLFVWNSSNAASWVTIKDLAISSMNLNKSATVTALKFPAGVTQSIFDTICFFGQGTIPGTSINANLIGTAIDMGIVSDTTTVRDCLIWFMKGQGIIIGHGSEIRIEGGRIIGDQTRTQGIGVHVTGNNGGVHIVDTDIIALKQGVVLDNSNGFGSNREIFISQATLDSCGTGLAVYDNSYVDIDGVWAASSDIDQIWVSPTSTGAMLTLTGGTIFNGGAIGGNSTTENNGLTVNAGSFSLTGVAVRNNKGRGIYIPNAQVTHYSITGCRIYSNGEGLKLLGSSYVVTGNMIYGNGANDFGSQGGGSVVANNVVL